MDVKTQHVEIGQKLLCMENECVETERTTLDVTKNYVPGLQYKLQETRKLQK